MDYNEFISKTIIEKNRKFHKPPKIMMDREMIGKFIDRNFRTYKNPLIVCVH